MSSAGAAVRVLLAIAVIAAFAAQYSSAQTFHYSHGWTNGKRSGGARDAILSRMAAAMADGSAANDDAVQQELNDLEPTFLSPLNVDEPMIAMPVKAANGRTLYKFYTVRPENRR